MAKLLKRKDITKVKIGRNTFDLAEGKVESISEIRVNSRPLKLPQKDDAPLIEPDSIFFSDLHLHDRKEFDRIDPKTGLNVRLMEGLNILDQIFTLCLSNPDIKTLYFLGDWTELKDKIPNHVLIELKRQLVRFIYAGVKIISLMGNHDYNLPNYPAMSVFEAEESSRLTDSNGETNWMYVRPLMERREDWFRFIKEPKMDNNIFFIPFQRNWEDFRELWLEVHKELKPRVICIHQELPGAIYETGKVVPGTFNLPYDSKILYLSGHVHKPQKVGPVQFLGSPYQTRFSDEGQDRFIWLYNRKTNHIVPMTLESSKFITLDWGKFEDIERPKDLENQIKGNYIRVTGEIPVKQYESTMKVNLKDNILRAGAKAVIFNLKIKRPSQSKIAKDLVGDDIGIIKQYAKENVKDTGLELEELIKIGEGLYENA